MSELTECPLCLERYNKTTKIPKILSCGHTFCQECLTKQNKYKLLECSICRQKQTITHPEQLITNRTIFDLLYMPKVEEERTSDGSYNKIETYKIIMLGPANAGKTSLIRRYIYKKFNEDYQVTVGFDYMSKELKIGKRKIKIELWDTAGTEMFQSLSAGFFRNSYGALIVFDVIDRKSFQSLETWVKYYREHKDENKEELIYLIGNKIDYGERNISKDEVEDFMINHNLNNYFETSAKNGDNVDKIFENIGKDIIKLYGNKKLKSSGRITLNKDFKDKTRNKKKCHC